MRRKMNSVSRQAFVRRWSWAFGSGATLSGLRARAIRRERPSADIKLMLECRVATFRTLPFRPKSTNEEMTAASWTDSDLLSCQI